MHVRSPGVPDEPAGDQPAQDGPPGSGDGPPAIMRHPDGSVRFGVPTRIIVAKLGAAAVLAIVALFAPNRSQVVTGLIAAVGLGVYGLRDVLARERLRAGPDGVLAGRGLAGHSRLAWADIERVRIDSRNRLGARGHLLEIDAGEQIFLYSRFDLGVDPADAAIALESVRVP